MESFRFFAAIRVCALVITAFLAGCAPSIYYVTPLPLLSPEKESAVITSFRPYLKGKIIFLDPGHGGEDRVNRGPGGEAIEADVNLRVGLALREFLTEAGATVLMSRVADSTVELRSRPLMAAESGAEIFISLHHNASSDHLTNFSSVFYHAVEGHPEFHPANHDLARYVQRDVSYAMRNPSTPGSPTFDGTLSDFSIYPNSGFAVLRQNWFPSILVEASFFTHPHEEHRLALEQFDRIEAWGIFTGLGRYFRAGRPTLVLQSDSLVTDPATPIVVGVSSDRPVDSLSVQSFLDGTPINHVYNSAQQTITCIPDSEFRGGYHTFSAWAWNNQGSASWQFGRRIAVRLPARTIHQQVYPAQIPANEPIRARLVCTVSDKNGDPVIDGTEIHCLSPGVRLDSILTTTGGVAVVDFAVPALEDSVILTAAAESVATEFILHPSHSPGTYFAGQVYTGKDSMPLPGVQLVVGTDSSADSSPAPEVSQSDGWFFIFAGTPENTGIRLQRAGYFTRTLPRIPSGVDPIPFIMTPVAGGKLFGKTYLIDPRYGGNETGDTSAVGIRASDVNLEIAATLASLLHQAGALVSLTRSTDTTMQESDRARLSSSFPAGFYIRVDAAEHDRLASCNIHASIPNRRLAASLLYGLSVVAGTDSGSIDTPPDHFFREVALGTVSVAVPSPMTGFFDADRAIATGRLAWGLFLGILRDEGFPIDTNSRCRAIDDRGLPVAGAQILLNETLATHTDSDGYFTFFGVVPDNISFHAPAYPSARFLHPSNINNR